MSENLLARETSPYLLQHKDNPVHWMPWGEEAFAAALKEDKPVLLSIGYAACHWCHVMAHESFEDDEIAALMNAHFIAVKVDREERPDVDKIYMDSLHALGEQGGWPLTMFLKPDGTPFWGGTYFPKETKYGRPGFGYILQEIARIWRDERQKADINAKAILNALKQRTQAQSATQTLSDESLLASAKTIVAAVDTERGGLKGAPKFPQIQVFDFLWRMHLRTHQPEFSKAVIVTLANLSQGGIYDHLGGGFSRYSVDHRWLVPHFEKMLYDNALIVSLLSHVVQTDESRLFRTRIEETVSWLLGEMRLSPKSFASSYDADSEGEEGRYYVWTEKEIRDVLPRQHVDLFCQVYDVTNSGNWEGHVILNRLSSMELLSDEAETALSQCRQALLAVRQRRAKPGFDDKVLADWNGLAISALVDAGIALRRQDWIDAAESALQSIMTSHWKDGRLYHSWRREQLRNLATADDYANLIAASLKLHSSAGSSFALEASTRLATAAIEYLWDAEARAFFFSSPQAPAPILRPHYSHDDATPNANAIMVRNLYRLYLLTGNTSYRTMSESILDKYGHAVTGNPFAYGSLLSSFDDVTHLLQAVVIGKPQSPDARALSSAVYTLPVVDPLTIHIETAEGLPKTHPAFGKKQQEGKSTLYLCRGTTCGRPVTDPESVHAAFATLM